MEGFQKVPLNIRNLNPKDSPPSHGDNIETRVICR